MSIALDLIAQRPDHLRVAQIAAFADVDIAPGKFERRIGPHAVGGFDRAAQIKQRHHFNETADGNDDQDTDQEQDRVAFQDPMFLPERRHWSLYSAGARPGMTSDISRAG